MIGLVGWLRDLAREYGGKRAQERFDELLDVAPYALPLLENDKGLQRLVGAKLYAEAELLREQHLQDQREKELDDFIASFDPDPAKRPDPFLDGLVDAFGEPLDPW